MDTFKKPYQQALLESFVLGKSTAEAARAAGVSEATARRFRKQSEEAVRELQAKSMEGVLKTLKDMLPEAMKLLDQAIKQPIGTIDHMRVVATAVNSFKTLRDVDYEKRLKALEARLLELTKGATSGTPQPK